MCSSDLETGIGCFLLASDWGEFLLVWRDWLMCGKDGGGVRKENQRRDNIFCVKWGDRSKGTNGHWVTEEEGKRE